MSADDDGTERLQAAVDRSRAHGARALWELHHVMSRDLRAAQAKIERLERRLGRTEQRLKIVQERLNAQRRAARRQRRRAQALAAQLSAARASLPARAERRVRGLVRRLRRTRAS